MSQPSPDFGGWNLPFEEQPVTALHHGAETLLAGGLVVMGAMTPTPLGTFPALVFRFEVPGTRTMPSIVLLLDAQRMREVPALVEAAANAAIRKAASR